MCHKTNPNETKPNNIGIPISNIPFSNVIYFITEYIAKEDSVEQLIFVV